MKHLFVFLLLGGTASAELTWDKREIALTSAPTEKSVTARFKFKNAGTTPVKIVSVKNSCSCTTAALEKTEYSPNESGEIVVTFELGERTGVQSKTILVQTNDPQSSDTTLKLAVTIPTIVDIKPGLLFWKTGTPNKAKSVSIKIPETSPARLITVESASDTISAKLVTLKPGSEYSLQVTPLDTSKPTTAEVKLKAKLDGSDSRDFFVRVAIK